MRRKHDLRTTPGLVDTPVADDVRETHLGVVGIWAVAAHRQVAEVRVDDAARGVDRGVVAARLFQRDRARHPVAELGGIGDDLPARITRIRVREEGDVRGRRRRVEVVERLRRTEGEARELDERAVGGEVGRCRLRAVVVHAHLQVRAQRAVLGLLAAVEPGVGAGAHRPVLAVDAIAVAATAGLERAVGLARGAVRNAGLELRAHISADLQADVGARDVVEAVPVERADLHVLHRLCLHRQIGSLRPSNRDEPRGGTEEKTFHHLHLNLHLLSWEGSVSAGRCSPWKVP